MNDYPFPNPVRYSMDYCGILDMFTNPAIMDLSCWSKAPRTAPDGQFALTKYSGHTFCLENHLIVSLFLYHTENFYQLDEMSEKEYSIVVPAFEDFLRGEEYAYGFEAEQIGVLLWLCSNRRISLDWQMKLTEAFARRYADARYNVFFGDEAIATLLDYCRKGFGQYFEK